MKREQTCCFTGHRPHKLPMLNERGTDAYAALERDISLAILTKVLVYHCDTFISGMARGADLLCAELVLDVRRMFRLPLRLVCAVPYLAQAEKWDAAEQRRYKAILAQADEKILLSREYRDTCLQERNRFMVDHSAHLIAIYDGRSPGGTRGTLEYARSRGLGVAVVNPFRKS